MVINSLSSIFITSLFLIGMGSAAEKTDFICKCTKIVQIELSTHLDFYGCIDIFRDEKCTDNRNRIYSVEYLAGQSAQQGRRIPEGPMTAFKPCKLDPSCFTITTSLTKIKLLTDQLNGETLSKIMKKDKILREEVYNNSTGSVVKKFSTRKTTSESTRISLLDVVQNVNDYVEEEEPKASIKSGTLSEATLSQIEAGFVGITPKITAAYREKLGNKATPVMNKTDANNQTLNETNNDITKHDEREYFVSETIEIPACTNTLVQGFHNFAKDLWVEYEAYVNVTATAKDDGQMLEAKILQGYIPGGLEYVEDAGTHGVIAKGLSKVMRSFGASTFLQTDSVVIADCCSKLDKACKRT